MSLNQYPNAVQRPIGLHPTVIVPRIIILHTMAGFLGGTDSLFHRNGPHGDNSHFGIGGQWDGPALDGTIYQWQDCDRQANAQFSGNRYGISIETSDGAASNVKWDDKQVASIIALCTWLCHMYKIPARLVNDPSESGFGYHSLFKDAWNHDSHNCPGNVRAQQLVSEVIPKVAANLGGDEVSPQDIQNILLALDNAAKETAKGNVVPGTVFMEGISNRTVTILEAREAAK